MILLYIIGGILLMYGLLYFLVPKGNPLHEFVQLPIFLAQSLAIPVKGMEEEKHKFGKHWRQYLLYFKPSPDTPSRNQVVIYLHGGGWQFGSPEMFRYNAKVFTDQGYHVFCISYRRIPFHNFVSIHEDMSKGLTKVLQIMKDNDLQDKKICLGGMSAGAHLVAMLLYDRDNLAKLGLTQDLFSGIFLCGGPLDLRQMRRSYPVFAIAGRRSGQLFKRSNPIEFLQEDEQTPVLAVHGTRDGLVEYPAGKVFAERLKKINPNIVQFYTIENGNHLDASRWGLKEDEVRRRILGFIERLERKKL